MKTWALRIALVAALVAAAFMLRDRTPPPVAPEAPDGAAVPDEPVEPDWSGASRAVNDFFQAAGDGDDEAYLDLVDGPLRRSLEQSRAELGPEAFRGNLRRTAAGIKGLAVTPGGAGPEGSVALDVEIVFADRNEKQRMLLVPKGSRWVITTIDRAQRIEPEVPYGTPVFEEAEEGGGGKAKE